MPYHHLCKPNGVVNCGSYTVALAELEAEEPPEGSQRYLVTEPPKLGDKVKNMMLNEQVPKLLETTILIVRKEILRLPPTLL